MTSSVLRWTTQGERRLVSLCTASFFPGHVGVTVAVRPLHGAVAIVQGRGDRATAERLVEYCVSVAGLTCSTDRHPELDLGGLIDTDQQGAVWIDGTVSRFAGSLTSAESFTAAGDGWVFVGNLLAERPEEPGLHDRLGPSADRGHTALSFATETLHRFLDLPSAWADRRGVRSLGVIALDVARPEDVVDLRVDDAAQPARAMWDLLQSRTAYAAVLDHVDLGHVRSLLEAHRSEDADLVFSWLMDAAPAAPGSELDSLIQEALGWLTDVDPPLGAVVRRRFRDRNGTQR